MSFDVKEYIEQVRETYADGCGERFAKHIRSSRFPFTYHHDEVRKWVGPNVSRETVAVALEERFGKEKDYIDAACRGAFARMVSEYTSDMLDDIHDMGEGELTGEKLEVYTCILAQASKFDREAWLDYFSPRATD